MAGSKWKGSQKQKAHSNRPKPRYTLSANLYHKEVIAPLERKFRHALKKKNYEEAGLLFRQILKERTKHRHMIYQREKVEIPRHEKTL